SPTRSGEAQPGLRHGESVLELGLFRSRQGSRKLLLRPAACLLGLLDRYLVGVLGDVGEDGDSIWEDFEEPAPHEEQLLVAAVSRMGTYLPSRPVKRCATLKGCDRNLCTFRARVTTSLSSSDSSSMPRMAMMSCRSL